MFRELCRILILSLQKAGKKFEKLCELLALACCAMPRKSYQRSVQLQSFLSLFIYGRHTDKLAVYEFSLPVTW